MFKKPQLPEVEKVELKPWHGIRPAWYILGLHFLFLLILFFLICLLPGLISNKEYISFNSNLPVFGVYEDGKYLGNGYGTVLETTGGEHSYTFTYEGIEIGSTKVTVPKHSFFTFFHNYIYKVTPSFSFTEEVKAKAEEEFASSIALYSPIVDYSADVKYPSLFMKFAQCAQEMSIADVRDVWLYGALHITSSVMYDDYIKGREILENGSISFKSSSLQTVESYLLSLYGENSVKEVVKTDETTEIEVVKEGSFYRYTTGQVTLGRTTETSYPESNSLPQTLTYDTFFMSGNLVTENEYALFVDENPLWSKDNVDELVSLGLADSNYLKDITLSSRSSRPIRYISWYAAVAYTKWKSQKDGIEYSLPTLSEWTVAALSAKEKKYVTSLVYVENNSSTPTSLMGQLWDMTETVYMPLMRLLDEEAVKRLADLYPYDDIIVMGGSYVNENITLNDIGVVDKAKTSEFNGFRLVKHE